MRNWDFERWMLTFMAVLILGGLGFVYWMDSRADELAKRLPSAESQLSQIGAFTDEIYMLEAEKRRDGAVEKGAYAYLEEMMVKGRMGKNFQIPKPSTREHGSYKDTLYVLSPRQGEDYSRYYIGQFMLYVEGNTNRMKVTRLKLSKSSRKGAGPDDWRCDFTITDRSPIALD